MNTINNNPLNTLCVIEKASTNTKTGKKRSVSELGSSVLIQESDPPPLKKHKINFLNSLPTELFVAIAKFLPTRDILSLKSTCHPLDEKLNHSKIIESILDARLATCNSEEDLLLFLKRNGGFLKTLNLSSAKFKLSKDIPNKVAPLCPKVESLKFKDAPVKKRLYPRIYKSKKAHDHPPKYITNYSKLGSCVNLKNLELVLSKEIHSLIPLSTLSNLERLKLEIRNKFVDRHRSNTVYLSSNIDNLIPLTSLTKLNHLDLKLNCYEGISSLGSLTSLTNLNYYSTLLSNLTGLSSLRSLKHLNLTSPNINDLNPLISLTELVALQIFTYNFALKSIEPLSKLKNLNLLKINGTFNNLEPLNHLTNLTNLEIAGQFEDIKPLGSLMSLENLTIATVKPIDLGTISLLTHLKKLYLTTTLINNFEAVCHLINLSHLIINNESVARTDGNNFVLEPLKQLTKLTFLDIQEHFNDIKPLSSLMNLEYLKLDTSKVIDLDPVSSLSRLTHFQFSVPEINNFEAVSYLLNLKHLDMHIEDTQEDVIRNLEPLRPLNKLESFILIDDEIGDLDPISNHTNLHHLELDCLKISDINPLINLTKLICLKISSGINITDISPISSLTNLENLQLPAGYNTLEDIPKDAFDEIPEHFPNDLPDSTDFLLPLTKLQHLKLNRSFAARFEIDHKKLKDQFGNIRIEINHEPW
jgi:Leucine-rich repeat (LRR) protein